MFTASAEAISLILSHGQAWAELRDWTEAEPEGKERRLLLLLIDRSGKVSIEEYMSELGLIEYREPYDLTKRVNAHLTKAHQSNRLPAYHLRHVKGVMHLVDGPK